MGKWKSSLFNYSEIVSNIRYLTWYIILKRKCKGITLQLHFFLLVTFPESIDTNKSFLFIGIIIEGLILMNSDTQEVDKVSNDFVQFIFKLQISLHE